jgi:hypothetical protein
MTKLVKLTFLDAVDKKHELLYNLHPHSLARRWEAMTLQSQAMADQTLTARLTNVAYSQIARVREQLTSTLNTINGYYDQPLPLYEDIVELGVNELNYLHEEFERYGDRHGAGELGRHNQTLHDSFLRLNELIHLHEDVLSSKHNANNLHMAVLWDYYPQGLHQPIEEADKIHLESDLKWGGLYLGYNTLGKDWMKVQHDNDVEVVERGQVRPQARFAAEAWANFGPDCPPGWTAYKFEAWWRSLPPNLQQKVPIGDLNGLTLGRFRIGTLLTDENFCSRYGGQPSDYRIPNSPWKSKWNGEVFATFVDLVGVDFIND